LMMITNALNRKVTVKISVSKYRGSNLYPLI